ncbi:MAG: cyclic nucleotide-binding domain-containing protein [Blautia sp.]|nr:cyclic nucleotide-binding domain-containing protein [Blautia sp.]MCM1201043.1 cyclic nucleotide-binding domain-containing protein [Bacteroides fragilis]
MAVKEFSAGTVLFQNEQTITALHVITKGSVKASYPGGEFYLSKGDVIGVCGLFYDSYFISYQAVEDTTLASYACTNGHLSELLRTKSDLSNLIVGSLFRQIKDILDQYEMAKFDCDSFYQYLMKSYSEYERFCLKHGISPRVLPGLESVTELKLEEDVPNWLNSYYRQLQRIMKSITAKSQIADFILGTLLKASQDVYDIIYVCRELHEYKSEIADLLMNENKLDFFDLYASILYRIGAHNEDSTAITAALGTMMIQLENQDSIDKEMYRDRVQEYKRKLEALHDAADSPEEHDAALEVPDLTDSLHTILTYADCDEKTTADFKAAIAKYNKLADKNASDDNSRKLRMTITKLFYQVYSQAFMKSLSDTKIPKIVKMFFNFGYVDETLAGMENASYLYSIVDSLPSDPSRNVYTAYEWLKEVYEGRKAPCRNEFDNDYAAYVHELKVTGKITAAEEAPMLTDRSKQVQFELDNMFQSVNKITFGRISIFCPVFSESNVLKDLPESLVSADKVKESFERIRATDFSAYYRDTMYSRPDIGIARESVSVEILPDVILMPNVGIRGVMWQEIEGRKRTTPARMMVSLFQMEDLSSILVRLTGEYRWEMCKRIQSARWNDVSEPSLTSEYFDYIQFYKKNRELSADAKDKVKLSMQKAKNSFKEMFIRDYESWIIYEGAGSPRLNKVARGILFSYCPFSKEVRDRLKSNPLYKETMDRYGIKQSQKIHHMDNLIQKIKNSGAEIPTEIAEQRAYLLK